MAFECSRTSPQKKVTITRSIEQIDEADEEQDEEEKTRKESLQAPHSGRNDSESRAPPVNDAITSTHPATIAKGSSSPIEKTVIQ